VFSTTNVIERASVSADSTRTRPKSTVSGVIEASGAACAALYTRAATTKTDPSQCLQDMNRRLPWRCQDVPPLTTLPASYTDARVSRARFVYDAVMETTSSGLSYEDTVVGTGPSPTRGQTCVMHYTGWLWVNGAKGEKFDSSLDRGRPFEFPLGMGRVIKGWDEGVASMRVGGKRTLLIPAQLGYGERGAGGKIPPGATLLFEVELLRVA
jgi:peptidylprolyl isomerase